MTNSLRTKYNQSYKPRCRNCRKEFTEDNPEVGFGHCRSCIRGDITNEPT